MAKPRPVGRPRDPELDQAILSATQAELATNGYEAMSLATIAERAGTTRQALYRRWSNKADLATAAIGSMARHEEGKDTDDPYADLLFELSALHRALTRPNGISMIGSMLQESVDPELCRFFRDRVIHPRRRRLKHILQRGVDDGLLRPDADLDYAVAACSGILYSLSLHGVRIPANWPKRTALLVWRSAGGS